MVLTCPIMHFLWDQKRYKGVTFERGSPQWQLLYFFSESVANTTWFSGSWLSFSQKSVRFCLDQAPPVEKRSFKTHWMQVCVCAEHCRFIALFLLWLDLPVCIRYLRLFNWTVWSRMKIKEYQLTLARFSAFKTSTWRKNWRKTTHRSMLPSIESLKHQFLLISLNIADSYNILWISIEKFNKSNFSH